MPKEFIEGWLTESEDRDSFFMRMRKILTWLIALAVALPGLGFICDCCPAYAQEASQPLVISSPHCNFCPDATQVSKDNPLTRSNQEFSFTSSVVRLLSLSFIMVNSAVEPNKTSTQGIDFSPPGRSSDTPLYLALEVLRL